MLKKAASGVLALLPCSRTQCTLRAPKGLRPCPWKRGSWRPWDWAGEITDFFEHSLQLMMPAFSWAFIGQWSEIFNSSIHHATLDISQFPLQTVGNVEKSRQRRSRPFAVLTYTVYAPRAKRAAALPVEKGVLAPLGLGG